MLLRLCGIIIAWRAPFLMDICAGGKQGGEG
jgi:hypothetical protein